MPSLSRPTQLYVIGNGFDRYHGARSSYWHFRGYLLRHDEVAAKYFEEFFGPRATLNNFKTLRDYLLTHIYGKQVPYPRNTWAAQTLWCDFERYLGDLDREKVFDMIDAALPRVDTDDDRFSMAAYRAPIDRVADIVRACTFEMAYHLHRWVNTLQYERGFKHKMLQLDPDALYLNFNYTLFLEEHYHLPRERICYIHGHRRQPFGSLVLGHNKVDADAEFERWFHQHQHRKRYRPNLKDSRGRYFANDRLSYLAYFHDDEQAGVGN